MGMVKKVGHRLLDSAGASSRNLGSIFLTIRVTLYIQRQREMGL